MWRVPALVGAVFHKAIMKTRKPFPKLSSVLFEIALKMPFLVKMYDLWDCKCCGGKYNVQFLRGYMNLWCTHDSEEDMERAVQCKYNKTEQCKFSGCHLKEGSPLNVPSLMKDRARGVLFLAFLMGDIARKRGYCAVNATYDSLDAVTVLILMGRGFCYMGVENEYDIVHLGIKVKEDTKRCRTVVAFHEKSGFLKKLRERYGEEILQRITTEEDMVDEYIREWKESIMGGEHLSEMLDKRGTHVFSHSKGFKRG